MITDVLLIDPESPIHSLRTCVPITVKRKLK